MALWQAFILNHIINLWGFPGVWGLPALDHFFYAVGWDGVWAVLVLLLVGLAIDFDVYDFCFCFVGFEQGDTTRTLVVA